jgi:poly-gamma-glutamate capsule biosynthesis protein CapA/YwtB (metallophosphatase superfamily)
VLNYYKNKKQNWLNLLLFLSISKIMLPAQDTLSLIFTGDIINHESILLSAKTGRGKFDFNPCFSAVKPILEKADLAIGNLETTLPGRWPYMGFQFAPVFRSPDELAVSLKNAGFDILFTANNHSNDGQARGLRETIKTLRRLEIIQSGTFLNASERASNYPLIVEKKGFKLAFLNATFGTNGWPTFPPNIVNRLDTSEIRRDLLAAKKQNPDFIIAVLHWGIEHQLTVSDEQRRLAEFLVAEGVDLIIGMHPHVVQPIEKIEATSGQTSRREGLVAFSLGNFISNHHMINADGGLMFRIELIRDSLSHKAMLFRHGYLPVWRSILSNSSGKKTWAVLPVQELEFEPVHFPALDEKALEQMLSFATTLRNRLTCLEWCENY